MAFVLADRVWDTSTTTGTGALTLSGSAPNNFRAFSAVLSVGDTCYYSIRNQAANEFEEGLGTYSSANTLTRTTVYSSSNSNSAVSLSAGTKDVFISFLANRTVVLDGSGNAIALGTPASANLTNATAVPSAQLLAGTIPAVGFSVTAYNAGTFSSGTFTPAAANGNTQYATNNGAHAVAAPSSDCSIDILYTNGASAGAISFTSFSVGSNTGDTYATTNTNKYILMIRRMNGTSTYAWKALQ